MRDFIESMTWLQKIVMIIIVFLVFYTDVAFRNGDYQLAFLCLGSTLLTAFSLSFTFKKGKK